MRESVRRATLAAAVVAGLAAGSAQAASVSYFMDQSNTLADGVNYLQVTIDDEGAPGLINFTVQVLGPLSSIAGSNFGIQSFGFNVAPSASLPTDASITNLPSGWSGNVAPPPNQLDGFGSFDAEVNDGGSARVSTLSFSVMWPGDFISSYVDLSGGNAGQGNVYFSAHVAGFDDGYGNTSAYFGGSTPVPVPAALWLLGSGLLGLGGLMRKRRAG